MTTFQECRDCTHNEVCAFKKEYDACCKAIYTGSYSYGGQREDGLNVRNFEDSPMKISVDCPHYRKAISNPRGLID